MKDFENKVIRVTFNTNSGWLVEAGDYIKMEGSFLVFRSQQNNKLKYINVDYIKLIEIVGEING